MTIEAKLVLGILGFACVAMASNRMRYDIIAILVMLLLMLTNILTPAEALSGFGSPIIIMIASLLVVGEMLERTGIARLVGDFILKRGGKRETILIAAIMISACILGGVMSSTAIVAVFLPIVLRIASKTGLNASRLLMPMSYAALISGMITLISTPPNIVVHEELRSAGYEGFSFFSFTPIGLAVLGAAVCYLLLIRKWLPARAETIDTKKQRDSLSLLKDYGTSEGLDHLRVQQASSLIGNTVAETDLDKRYGTTVYGVRKEDGSLTMVGGEYLIELNDTLIVRADPNILDQLMREMGLHKIKVTPKIRERIRWEFGMAEILVHPESGLVGQSICKIGIQSRYGLRVMGIRRKQTVQDDYSNTPLEEGDILLISGPWERIQALHMFKHDFVVLRISSDQADVVPAYRKLPVALGILGLMIFLSVTQIIPLVSAVILAALLAVLTRCLNMDQGYRAIHWNSIVLTAGMLPLADALQQTGVADMMVDGLMYGVGQADPRMMFTALFFLTALLGLFLSNTASAVLVAPIAVAAAEKLGVSPYPLCMAVLIAASAAFMTPVSTPVVTLIVEPGRYRFIDFLRIGTPLLIITYLVTLLTAPILFPF